MSNDHEYAQQVAIRAWRLRGALDIANTAQELRGSLVMEITMREAAALVTQAANYGKLDLYFLHPVRNPDGLVDWEKVHLNDELPVTAMGALPRQGERWAELYGIPLVWLGVHG